MSWCRRTSRPVMVGAIAMSFLRFSSCCLLVLAAAHLAAADPDPAKANDKEKGPPPERIVSTAQAVGTVGNWNETDGKFTLHMKVKYIEPNLQAQQNYARDMQNLMIRQQNLARITNPV